MQGRAGYGGLVGALALKAMRSQVPAGRKVRSLLVAFVGPVGPAPFSIQTLKLREGKWLNLPGKMMTGLWKVGA